MECLVVLVLSKRKKNVYENLLQNKIFPQDDKKYILKITYILICMEKYSVKMIKIHIKNILSNHIFF
jgi:hypothetical protein